MRHFISDKRGVVALMFGMMLPVIVASMGLGYDMAQAYLARSRLAQSLDAAGLAAAGSSGSEEQLQQRFLDFMQANYPPGRIGELGSLSFTKAGNDIIVTGNVNVQTAFMQIFGQESLIVTAKSTINRELNGLEVAMVLDNTGSMAGSKMTNLKEAAKNFIDIMADAAANNPEPDSVLISLVPYTMTVNVGTAYANSTWLDKAGNSAVAKQAFTGTTAQNRINKFTSMGLTWGGCVEMRASPHDVSESPPTASNVNSLYVPYFAVDEPDSSSSTYGGPYYNNYRPDGTSNTNWFTRQGNPNKYTAAPTKTGTNSIGYKYGPNSGCEIQSLMRLTDNFASLKTKVDAMNPLGDTNSNLGLMWGWHTLSPSAPFSDGIAYNTPKHQKILLLMTDGLNNNVVIGNNNKSAYSGIGYIWQNRMGITDGTLSQRRAKMDEKMAQLCENIREAGITIYTVRLETNDPDPNSEDAIEGCSGDPTKFYDVEDSDELTVVFESIANSIQALRLTE